MYNIPKNFHDILDDTPRCQWKEIKEDTLIQDSKLMLLFNPNKFEVHFGVYTWCNDLEDYVLMNEDSTIELNFEDYSHFSYPCLPLNWEFEFTDKYKDLIEKNVDKS